LMSAVVVLPGGTIVDTAKRGLGPPGDLDHEQLMWALRGGGGNFGVVVSLTHKAHKADWGGTPSNPKQPPGHIYHMERILLHAKSICGCLGNGLGGIETLQAWRDYSLSARDVVACDYILPAGAPVMIQQYTYAGLTVDALAEKKNWAKIGTAIATKGSTMSYFTSVQRS